MILHGWMASLFLHREIQNKEKSSLKGQSRFVLEAVAFFCPPKRRIVYYVTACCKWPIGTQGICVTLDFIKKNASNTWKHWAQTWAWSVGGQYSMTRDLLPVCTMIRDSGWKCSWYRKREINYIIKNQFTWKKKISQKLILYPVYGEPQARKEITILTRHNFFLLFFSGSSNAPTLITTTW